MRINRTLLHWCRTIHIYLTLFGLLVMLLFGATGFTINHEEWFGATTPHVVESTGQLTAGLLAQNDRLAVVEELRKSFHIHGAVSGYDDLGQTLSIGFKEPGTLWEVTIDKASGTARVHTETFNFAAIINNLHRGRYAGEAWKWVIDASAMLIVLACATGVVLWLALPKRRKLGIAALVIGTATVLLIYLWFVPGAGSF